MTSAKTKLYFAYGSNMSVVRLQARVASATFLHSAVLHSHELRFDKLSTKDGSGKCHIVAEEGAASVHGVVFSINANDESELDVCEGLGYGYAKKEVVVESAGGASARAFTYFATAIDATLQPYSWYMRHVIEGAQLASLPHPYLQWLKTIETVQDADAERHAKELSIY